MRLLAAALLLVTVASSAIAGPPPVMPSDPAAQKQWAVDIARWKEENPLWPDKKINAQILGWWVNADLTLSVCAGPLLEVKNKDIRAVAVLQQMVSSGAFLIEHPAEAADPLKLSTAGVEGALRAYEHAVAVDPKLRDEVMDNLLKLRGEGRLTEYVAPKVAACEKKSKK